LRKKILKFLKDSIDPGAFLFFIYDPYNIVKYYCKKKPKKNDIERKFGKEIIPLKRTVNIILSGNSYIYL